MRADKDSKSKDRKQKRAKFAKRLAHKLFPSGKRPTQVHRDKRAERTSKVSKRELERELEEGEK